MITRGLTAALLEVFPKIPRLLAVCLVNIIGILYGIPFLSPVRLKYIFEHVKPDLRFINIQRNSSMDGCYAI